MWFWPTSSTQLSLKDYYLRPCIGNHILNNHLSRPAGLSLWQLLYIYKTTNTWELRLRNSEWMSIALKGQWHEIFRFWFFSTISFPPAPEYPIRTVSKFLENSRGYSQLKVDHRCRWHRWQMRKIFNQKNFNNFVGTPLDSRVNTYIHFWLQVHFMVSAAWYCCHYFPPVSLTPVANLPPVSLIPVTICHRCRWHRRQICHRYQQH